MMTPAELRAEANRLEAVERDMAIVARCRFGGFEWDRNGLCFRRYSEFVPCRGYNGQKHHDSYRDEYSGWCSCRGCNGSGQNYITHRVRAPEFDAPRPPKEAT
jgi:hypothetical protein